jgi:hypothetical protein
MVKFFISVGVDPLTQTTQGEQIILIAAMMGHLSIVRFCIEGINADIEAPNTTGLRPLHYAVTHLHSDVVRYPVDAKADIFAPDTNGETPVDIARSTTFMHHHAGTADYNEILKCLGLVSPQQNPTISIEVPDDHAAAAEPPVIDTLGDSTQQV